MNNPIDPVYRTAKTPDTTARLLGAWVLLGGLALIGGGCSAGSPNAAGAAYSSTFDGGAVDDASAADAGSWGGASSGGASSSGASSSGASSGGWQGGSDAGSAYGGSDTYGGSSSGGADAGSGKDNNPQTWLGKEGASPFASVDLGGGKKLKLEKIRVTVRVEGLRARTLVDHIYSNPHGQALEGTFRYSLPTEANVSYYAMFLGQPNVPPEFFGDGDKLKYAEAQQVAETQPASIAEGASAKQWGALRQGRVQEHVKAQHAYEEETKQKIDPALVQQVAPNTFTARVFPIQAGRLSRVMIAYEQTLPRTPNGFEYVFPLPEGEIDELEFTLLANHAQVTSGKHVGPVKEVIEKSPGGKLYLAQKKVAGKSTGGPLVFQFETASDDEADVLAGTDPKIGKDHAILRLRPAIKALQQTYEGRERIVFLLDTSRSEHGKRFELNMTLIEKILGASKATKQFNVVTFDAGARWFSKAWLSNDEAGRKAFFDGMKGVLLEGGTDLSAALRKLANPPMTLPQGGKVPVDVMLLSDGAISWGGRDLDAMLARYKAEAPWSDRFFAYRTGLGAENLPLLQALTRRGAIFNCMSLPALEQCATGHLKGGMLLKSVTVEPAKDDGGAMSDVLVAGRLATLYPGADLTVAGRVDKPGKVVVKLQGTVGDTAITHTIPVEVKPKGELAPRAWAEIAVQQLFDSGDEKLAGLAMALSQHYRIASSRASFVVLETDAAYKQYKLADWAAKYQGQALAVALEAAFNAGGKAFGTWARVLKIATAHDTKVHLVTGAKALLDAIQTATKASDLELPDSTLAIPLVMEKDVSPSYVSALSMEAKTNPQLHVKQAEQRRSAGQLGAAVRALSTATEMLPGDAEVARMTGYRLMSWNQMPMAAAQLLGVLESRPLEPQSWRDIANAVRQERPALAAVLYEAVLLGSWNAAFGQLKQVVKEEYATLIASGASGTDALSKLLTERGKTLGLKAPTDDLRITVTWNTNNTDIDLWVTSPLGEKCFYSHKKLSTGGGLLDDLTDGFGPERIAVPKAMAGGWKVQLHYYGNNGNKLIAETYAQIAIVQHAGKPNQSVSYHNVMLPKVNAVADVATVVFK